jgi:NAD+ kinase
MKRIGVIANLGKPRAPHVMAEVSEAAARTGVELVTCDRTAQLLPGARRVASDRFGDAIDVLMAFGGDGTLLRSVRTLDNVDIPVMGVNLGSLGFMTSVTDQEASQAVEVLAKDEYLTTRRTLATCRFYRDGAVHAEHQALNDIVIGWGASPRVVTLDVHIDHAKVTSYVCDGLIVSTPTGSTGHSLSAGGPILHPETPAFILNLICPHTLSIRPLVLPDDRMLTVGIAHAPKELILSVDGQETQWIKHGDRIEVTRAPKPIQFLHLPGYSYFSVLSQKLGWRGSVTQ